MLPRVSFSGRRSTTPKAGMTSPLFVFLLLVLASLVATVATDPGRSHSIRELQSSSCLWDISEPVISHSNLQLDLVHTVGGQVRSENVRIDLFQDIECSMPFDAGIFIAVDIFDDLSVVGDESGTRLITIQYNINATAISDSPLITYAIEDAIVSFCTRFSLVDPSRPNDIANSLDYPVTMRVDILERFEILSVLEDQEDSFRLEAFLCDSNNERITEPEIQTQGSRVGICVQPDSFTQDFDVVMKSINELKLIRGDVSQDVITPNGVIQDLIGTQNRCIAGEPICRVETEISNSFFYSQGYVEVQGEAWLQYAFSNTRRIVGIPSGVRGGDTPQEPAPLPSPIWNRKVFEAGGFVGSRDFDLEFEVRPSVATWQAEAFLCDGRNERLKSEALARPRNQDDEIRICFMPQLEARERGVYIREISSFFFEQGGTVQFAIKPSAVQAQNSIAICNAGEPFCAIKTKLSSDFFTRSNVVVGEGEVLLQYGTEPHDRHDRFFVGRALQDQLDPSVDAGFAGRAKVSIQFRTDGAQDPSSHQAWQETPLFLRIVYVVAALIGLLVLLCVLFAMSYGNPFSNTRRIFQQPVVVIGANGENKESDWMHDSSTEKSSTMPDDSIAGEKPLTRSSRRETVTAMDPSPDSALDRVEAQRRSPLRKMGSNNSRSPNQLPRRSSTGNVQKTKLPKRQTCGKIKLPKSSTPGKRTLPIDAKAKLTGQGPTCSSVKSPRPKKKLSMESRTFATISSQRSKSLSRKRSTLAIPSKTPKRVLSASPQEPVPMQNPLDTESKEVPMQSPKPELDPFAALACRSNGDTSSQKSRRSKQSSDPSSTSGRSMNNITSPPLTRRGERSARSGVTDPPPNREVVGASPSGGRRASLSSRSHRTTMVAQYSSIHGSNQIPDVLPF